MGVTWIVEILSWAIPNNVILYLLDIPNSAQGIIIFFMFVWKPKIKQMIVHRYKLFHMLAYEMKIQRLTISLFFSFSAKIRSSSSTNPRALSRYESTVTYASQLSNSSTSPTASYSTNQNSPSSVKCNALKDEAWKVWKPKFYHPLLISDFPHKNAEVPVKNKFYFTF